MGENYLEKKQALASMIDHTILKADASNDDVKKICVEALKYEFASVCVNPTHVSYVASLLEGSNVKTCTVIGFPLGATTTATKVFETKEAIENGATEVDMVVNVGAIQSSNWELVKHDIKEVVNAAKDRAIVKVIIETALLNEEQKRRVCAIAKESGADFVKTSTGFSTNGATFEDVALMREVVGPTVGVKASGGIKDRITAKRMMEAGANRIGTSKGVFIVQYEE